MFDTPTPGGHSGCLSASVRFVQLASGRCAWPFGCRPKTRWLQGFRAKGCVEVWVAIGCCWLCVGLSDLLLQVNLVAAFAACSFGSDSLVGSLVGFDCWTAKGVYSRRLHSLKRDLPAKML